MSTTYKITSLSIFCLGVSLNMIIPIMYAYCQFELNIVQIDTQIVIDAA